jgi:hypothetical protein
MPAFDRAWFDELRTLDAVAVQALPREAFVPHLHEAQFAGAVSNAFGQVAMDLLRGLYQTRYPFARDFCVYERHICVFPVGRAFRGQWNIGFYASDSREEPDYARIGVGFRLRRDIGPEGIDDYTDFVQRVLANPQSFDATFRALGNYAEGLPPGTPLSAAAIRNDNPNFDDDWRFYGKCVSDPNILQSLNRFLSTSLDVFDTIRRAGFF